MNPIDLDSLSPRARVHKLKDLFDKSTEAGECLVLGRLTLQAKTRDPASRDRLGFLEHWTQRQCRLKPVPMALEPAIRAHRAALKDHQHSLMGTAAKALLQIHEQMPCNLISHYLQASAGMLEDETFPPLSSRFQPSELLQHLLQKDSEEACLTSFKEDDAAPYNVEFIEDNALEEAIDLGYSKLSAVLIESGFPLFFTGKMGRTPLHTAILRQNEPLIDMLLNHGADPTLLDLEGQSSFELGRIQGLNIRPRAGV